MSGTAAEASWTTVASLQDFAGQRSLKISVEGLELLLVRQADKLFAVHNYCTHLGKPLDKGRIMAGQITCPFHGACFDIATGAAVSGPAVTPLHCFPARFDGEQVQLDLTRRPPSQLSAFPVFSVP